MGGAVQLSPTQRNAAQSLIDRAMRAERSSEAEILIASAKRLDPSVDPQAVLSQWLEQWLQANQNRTGESSQ